MPKVRLQKEKPPIPKVMEHPVKELLYRYRKGRGYSWEQVGYRLGLQGPSIAQQICRHPEKLTLERLDRLSNILEIPKDEVTHAVWSWMAEYKQERR